MTARAIIIGAPRSGSGKTSVTIGLLRAFARRGVKVRGIKTGPDYIDPGFHAFATGTPGLNLDSWAMQPDLLRHLFSQQTEDAELILIESAMGLFDGIPVAENRTGSAADLARLFRIPVLLVLDVSGQSQTAATIAHGFAHYDPDVTMGAVVLNRAGSERHRTLCTEAIEKIGLPVVGCVLRDPSLILPERHLGLVQASEHPEIDPHIDRLADAMEKSIDLDTLFSLAAPVDMPCGSVAAAIAPPGQRIALAEDAAFTFLYPHLRRHWRAAGAEIVPFSPLADEAPDESCDICWLPGGYPELFAGKLADAVGFKAGITRFAETKPVHGECGGYMVLGERLEDAEGVIHAMTGLLSHATSFATRKMNLGYRQATIAADSPLGMAGDVLRGHEFHYARVIDPGRDQPFAHMADGQGRPLGPSGGRRGFVSGTFFHAIAKGG
ncbi:cobyrinic acid a,c-diamide synthase [Agrobacterium tumefaciens]|uniref:Hydrogenobyrinate a,c-diamide synthase n=1 Tax=Agrobacterium fabrum (strain C58 / ATCC 33970) TaxID=176299 RepID=COBB_AGRFC|nr:cobyrinate a,c-diamide synthase [Agrobacterium fabrum]Q8UBQ8.1 RecName: Full=Hydrogenobyrinate a,c-diamide synthase; AltName: Full=Hydrogenobyrinic acid a,c-diamide synthase [Agrobacterium fabrum str. C58]KEY52521.1 cobyrinic acid a,c-diamide synthase [Agrobacterium tumefaciens]AAK88506.1 cobyrinic acid a,c-diamide synthase [Agrobacterium fabrum str. C58]KJX87439.1 cobyrinic acid a,c-diamide synthase [Agrobacterium tumefaciens]MCX2874922.1 cobyrinate a,c-diamide synthase [Agrobacterium fabr